MVRRSIRALLALAATALVAYSNADVQTWHNVGQIGGPIFWVAGLGSSLLRDGNQKLDHTARTFDGMLAGGLTSELLNVLTRERDPYGSGHGSFPSNHATVSFAVAAAQTYYHPKEAPLWYGGATLIGVARVLGHDHFIQDVVVGAGIGAAAGYLSVTSKHGWFLAPIVDKGRTGVEVSFHQSF